MPLFRKKVVKTGPDQPVTDEPRLSPITTLILADAAVRAGEALVRRGVQHGLLQGKAAKTSRVIRGRTLTETLIGTVLAEVARRSVPGAILVGGGLLAKALRDRSRSKAQKVADPE